MAFSTLCPAYTTISLCVGVGVGVVSVLFEQVRSDVQRARKALGFLSKAVEKIRQVECFQWCGTHLSALLGGCSKKSGFSSFVLASCLALMRMPLIILAVFVI